METSSTSVLGRAMPAFELNGRAANQSSSGDRKRIAPGATRASVASQSTRINPFLGKSLNPTTAISVAKTIHATRPTATRRCNVATTASLTIKEGSTGVEFPLVQKLWLGDEFRCMGAGARIKKIAFVGVKVYAISFYVEAEKAAHELGVRDRGGFFETDDDYASALVDGGFIKTVEIQLVRDVEGAQFAEALNKYLTPRMSLGGELSTLKTFSDFFEGRKLTKGTVIVLMYRTDATLDVVVRPNASEKYSEIVADLSIPSASLCRALYEVFAGESSVVPDAKKQWVEGAKALLDSEKVRRSTRKSGGG